MANKSKKVSSSRNEVNHFGKDLSFAAAEAYKLLRTNLMFFTPGQAGRVVGVTSSVSGEGKSTTTINLAYALAESGKKVVLVECDMRKPTVARRLNLQATPGLSNLIAGLSAPNDVLRAAELHKNFFVIPAGDIPPNPSELLGSEEMRKVIEVLAVDFDVVLVDLPPVTAVSDALVAGNLVDGMLVVVRQDVCTRFALRETMRQLQVIKDKILGFVFTCSSASGTGYYRKKSYRRSYRYGHRYGYGYGYGYGETQISKRTESDVSENETV